MPVSFAGTYTPADLRRALSIRRTALPNPNTLLFWLTTVSFVLLVIVGMVLNPARLWVALLFVAILVLLQMASSRLTPFLALEEWRSATYLREAQEGTISEEGIELRTPHTFNRHEWQAYHYYVTTPDMVLLFLGSITFEFYPRSFFQSDDAWQAFTSLVEQKISNTPPAEWRPIFARLNTLWVFAVFLTLFVGVAVIFSI